MCLLQCVFECGMCVEEMFWEYITNKLVSMHTPEFVRRVISIEERITLRFITQTSAKTGMLCLLPLPYNEYKVKFYCRTPG